MNPFRNVEEVQYSEQSVYAASKCIKNRVQFTTCIRLAKHGCREHPTPICFEIRDACAAEPSLTVARRDRADGARPVELDVLLQSRTETPDANALRDFREASTVKRR